MKVYILHGWTYSLDKWEEFCQQMQAAGYETIQLKVPGLTAPSSKVWTIDQYVEWLHKELAKESSPIVIGHSNGGRIALAYAQRYPGRLGKLVLVDSAGIPFKNRLHEAKRRTLRWAAKTSKPLANVKPLRKLVYRAVGAHDYLEAPPNMKRTLQNMLEADQRLDLASVQVPTTIIWGKGDTYTPLSMGKKMNRLISGSHLFVIAGAKHAPFYTHPHETIKLIRHELEEKP